MAFAEGSRLLVLRLAQYLLLFLVGVISARALGPDLRGQFALAGTLGGVAFCVFHLSLPDAAGRMIALREIGFRDASRLLAVIGVSLGIGGGVIAFAAGVAVRDVILNGLDLDLIALGALIAPLSVLQHYAAALLIRMGELRGYGWIAAITAGLQLGLIVGFALHGLTPELALLATVCSLLVGVFANWLFLGRALRAPDGFRSSGKPNMRRLLAIGLRLHGASLSLALMLGVDILIVGAFKDDSAVGLYSLATALAGLVFLGVTVISQSAQRTQTLAGENAAARFTADFVRASWVVALGCAILLGAVSYPLVLGVYGDAWLASVPPLMILVLAAVAFAIEGPIRNFLIRSRGPGIVSVIALGALALNVLLNVLLIPPVGIIGAAIASAASYWIYTGALLIRFRSLSQIPLKEVLVPKKRDLIQLVPALAAKLRA